MTTDFILLLFLFEVLIAFCVLEFVSSEQAERIGETKRTRLVRKLDNAMQANK